MRTPLAAEWNGEAKPLGELLDEVVTTLLRYVVFPLDEQADVIALWIAQTWTFTAFDYTPYLPVFSAETASGKSRSSPTASRRDCRAADYDRPQEASCLTRLKHTFTKSARTKTKVASI